MHQLLFYEFFFNSSLLRPTVGLLAFKRPMLDLTIQIWVRGSLKLLLGCYKTSFDNINFRCEKKAFQANRAAFLALTTFKFKNMEIMQ